MRLVDLNPVLKDSGVLLFDCPVHGDAHRIGVETQTPKEPGGPLWRMTGQFPATTTIEPSVDVPVCWHGWITNGEVR